MRGPEASHLLVFNPVTYWSCQRSMAAATSSAGRQPPVLQSWTLLTPRRDRFGGEGTRFGLRATLLRMPLSGNACARFWRTTVPSASLWWIGCSRYCRPSPPPTPDDGAGRARAVREPLEALRYARRRRITKDFPYTGESKGGAVLLAVHGLQDDSVSEEATLHRPAGGAPATEDDTLSRTAQYAISVDDHTSHVVERVTHIVRKLALPHPIARDLELAAYLHDAGKADWRFQVLLSGGDPWNISDGRAMAKSEQPSPTGAWARAGLPPGWRHEALSVRMAQGAFTVRRGPRPSARSLADRHAPWVRAAVLQLPPIRAKAGAEEDGPAACLGVEQWRLSPGPGPESLAFNIDGADWPALYERLRRRYGIWVLAHLEAVLRLSDHRASESERMSESEPTP